MRPKKNFALSEEAFHDELSKVIINLASCLEWRFANSYSK
jgi:hypothetical protein